MLANCIKGKTKTWKQVISGCLNNRNLQKPKNFKAKTFTEKLTFYLKIDNVITLNHIVEIIWKHVACSKPPQTKSNVKLIIYHLVIIALVLEIGVLSSKISKFFSIWVFYKNEIHNPFFHVEKVVSQQVIKSSLKIIYTNNFVFVHTWNNSTVVCVIVLYSCHITRFWICYFKFQLITY